jgi:hypothetical protein
MTAPVPDPTTHRQRCRDPAVMGPNDRHASNSALERALRAQTWKL